MKKRYHNPNPYQVQAYINGKRVSVSPLSQLVRQPALSADKNWVFFILEEPEAVKFALADKQLVETTVDDYPPKKLKPVMAPPVRAIAQKPEPSALIDNPRALPEIKPAQTAPAVAVASTTAVATETVPAEDIDPEDAAKAAVQQRLRKPKAK